MIRVILSTKSGMVITTFDLEKHDPFPDVIVVKGKQEERYYYFGYNDVSTSEAEKVYVYYEGNMLLIKE